MPTWRDKLQTYEAFLARECREIRQALKGQKQHLQKSDQNHIVNYVDMHTGHRPWPSDPYEMDREALIEYALKLLRKKSGIEQKEADFKLVRSQQKHDR